MGERGPKDGGALAGRSLAEGENEGPDIAEVSFRGEPEAPPFITAAELLALPAEPRQWLVEDLIPAGQLTDLRGDGGTGKSTLGSQLCVCAVSSRAWLGRRVMHGSAIYVACEDDIGETRRRLDSIVAHYRLDPGDLADLHLWPLATEDPALMVQGRNGLDLTPRWAQLVTKIEAVRPVVVVLDSRADVFGGNEIDRLHVRTFNGQLRRVAIRSGAALLDLSHPSLSGRGNGSGNSGSTHWDNSVRAVLYLRRPTFENGASTDPDARILEIIKSNYGPLGAAIPLRWSVGAFEVDGEPSRNLSRQEADAEAERVFLRQLAKFDARGIRVRASPGHGYAPTKFEHQEDAGGFKSKRFEAAMNRLLDAGKIQILEEGYPSRRTRYLAAVEAGP
jgi:RecA-family ATPase